MPLLVAVALVAVACGESEGPLRQQASELLAAGVRAHEAGLLKQATKDYRAVLALDTTDEFAHYNLGLIEQGGGDLSSARRNYKRALQSDPSLTPALFNLAIVHAQEGDLQGAIDYYAKVLAIEPENPGAHLNLGFALKETGSRKQGNDEIARAIELDPSLAARTSPMPSYPPMSEYRFE